MSADPVQELMATVRADLREALRRRDRAAASCLREILGTVDNVSVVHAPQGYDTGAAATEVARRQVTLPGAPVGPRG